MNDLLVHIEVAPYGRKSNLRQGPGCSALQPKLLRVLQEKELERLGSGRTHQINVRLIAATHRDLTELVRRGEFRSDLYYRLNVFPVLIPPLRERRVDIQLLVSHFVEVFARRMGKHIDQVPQTTMNALIAYPWPGNVRELQNLIERAVIRSDVGVLPNPLPRSEEDAYTTTLSEGTLMDSQRALILQVLEATGAIAQKIGRLELADQGTLFLDEVGDIPIEIQPKLLRALQEREFERLGNNRTKQVDVRLVAATNRDLEKMMEDREFRSDLYYRLNVFPIRIPPLRERPEDIPLLVRYFTQKYGRRMRKQIESIPGKAMKKLCIWHWPGNIRELENFIERSVILTRGPALQVPIAELGHTGKHAPLAGTREAFERDEIVRILKVTNGRVGGPDGAAARMGIKRTTLISRMKNFDIDRAKYREPASGRPV